MLGLIISSKIVNQAEDYNHRSHSYTDLIQVGIIALAFSTIDLIHIGISYKHYFSLKY